MKCEFCGANIGEGVKFCATCGSLVAQKNSAEQPADTALNETKTQNNDIDGNQPVPPPVNSPWGQQSPVQPPPYPPPYQPYQGQSPYNPYGQPHYPPPYSGPLNTPPPKKANIGLMILGIILGLLGIGITFLNFVVPFVHWVGMALGGAAIGIGSSQQQRTKGPLPIICIVVGTLSVLAFISMFFLGCAAGCLGALDII